MAEKTFETATVLIAEDVDVARMILKRHLVKLGVPTILEAVDGDQTMTLLAEHGDAIDTAIIDFQMPGKHGLQVLKAIRNGEAEVRRNLPVALLTGQLEAALEALAGRLDLDAFLGKPVWADVLEDTLRLLLATDREAGESYDVAEADQPLDDLLTSM
ncbi:MAG: response regulator [Alphaproteobacteria bacterium]|nr:response regulator [Alphaproteobacteria bacterium]